MKVDLSETLKELKSADFVDHNGHLVVQVQLDNNVFGGEEPELKWTLYAYSKDHSDSKWSEDCPSFDEALDNLKTVLKPKKRFVEED